MKINIALIPITLIVCVTVAHAEPTIWYVHPDSALNSIQAALDSCADNDIVLVAPGIYYEHLVWPHTQGIHLISELGPNETIIDGDSSGSVLHIGSVDSTTYIMGFTIQYGWSQNGGGIFCGLGASPSIVNNRIVYNHGVTGGGITCLFNSSPLIKNNTISNNLANMGGGILCSGQACPIIDSNIISFNRAQAQCGGGIVCWGTAAPLIMNNQITNNLADRNGGGMYISSDSAPQIIRNIITGNVADSIGGGIWCDYSQGIIRSNTLNANAATYGAGIACCNGSSPIIDSCVISENIGDGIFCNSEGNPVINYNNIMGNSGYGVINIDDTVIVDAEYNWWGDSTGPYHPILNPGGLGDSVSDYVDFIPWLYWSGVEERPAIIPVAKQNMIGPTIFASPLQLPKDKKCRVFDITGRVVAPDKIKPGIYFVEVDGEFKKKVIKIK